MANLRTTIRIGVILLGIYVAFPDSAFPQKTDSTQSFTSEWKLIELPYASGSHPFQIQTELYLGAGPHGNMTEARPPDSIHFGLNPSGLWLQFRLRVYASVIGISAFFDAYVDPLGGGLPRDQLWCQATSTSFQVLASFPVELLNAHLHTEPLFGCGWLTDFADAKENYPGGSVLYSQSYHGRGWVWGVEQQIRSGYGFQLRGIYTFADYELYDKRLKLEMQVSTDAFQYIPGDADHIETKKMGAIFFVLGYHRAWKGDGRTDSMIYIGLGGRVRL